MRHAFLIIAHDNFSTLQKLISSLDDVSNDLFVHIDKKVSRIPELDVANAKLFILPNRIDVRWGHVSQIKCELLLLEEAAKIGGYCFYHLISGTHLPIVDQNSFRTRIEKYCGSSLFSNLIPSGGYQETLKLRRINLFVSGFHSRNVFYRTLSQFLWKLLVAVQRVSGFEINRNQTFYWANNWASFSQEAVDYLLETKRRILKKYRYSFCGDEFFAPSELMNSHLAGRVKRFDELLYCSIGRSTAAVLTLEQYDDIIQSECLFARKFSDSEEELGLKILAYKSQSNIL